LKLVLIEWIDISAGRDWQPVDQIKEDCKPMFCRSVGWLVTERNGCKTIIPHLSGEKNEGIMVEGRGDLTIPNKAIIKITVLRDK
jgi:hypothetical protein